MSGESLQALLHRLQARLGRGAKLGLRGVRQALTQLGDPQRELQVVHVAGTNGKGSVCAMVEAMARAQGLRTGLYSSPHLCRFNERIRLDAAPIDDARFARALAIAMAKDMPPLTFFETMTVAAFAAMRDAAVELAILEVGLGGRLDATNVIDRPLVTAVTSIGIDHTRLLGKELEMIAPEKAAIAKPGRPLVVGPMAPEAARAIVRVGTRVGAGPIWTVRRLPGGPCGAWAREAGPAQARATASTPTEELRVAGPDADGLVELWAPEDRRLQARPRLAGPHQGENAAVAAGIGWWLAGTWPTFDAHIAAGLETVSWPGRLETIVHDGVKVILDGAHNVAAAEAVVRALSGDHDPTRTALVFGAMSDKSWEPILDCFAPLAATRYYTQPLEPVANRRSAALTALAGRHAGRQVPDPGAAIAQALAAAAPESTILVTGSIFLVGAVRAALLGLKRDQIVPL